MGIFPLNIVFIVAIEIAVAVAFYPCLRLGRRMRAIVLVAAVIVLCVCICLVPPQHLLVRGVDAMFCIGLIVTLYDLHHFALRGGQISFAQFLVYFGNDFWLVRARVPAEAKLSRWENARLLLRRAVGLMAALLLWGAVLRVDWRLRPFWAEHAAKITVIYLSLVLLTNAAAAGWRLLGGIGLDPFEWALLARTPAEFWRRWNRPAAQFLNEYVFIPAGGRRRPVRATLATFVVSAIIHETLFALILGVVQGFQLAFFMLNGVAAVLTLRVRPRGAWAAAAIALTLAFELATAVLFFASVNHVVPIYSRPLPGWLGAWDRATLHR